MNQCLEKLELVLLGAALATGEQPRATKELKGLCEAVCQKDGRAVWDSAGKVFGSLKGTVLLDAIKEKAARLQRDERIEAAILKVQAAKAAGCLDEVWSEIASFVDGGDSCSAADLESNPVCQPLAKNGHSQPDPPNRGASGERPGAGRNGNRGVHGDDQAEQEEQTSGQG